jgi:hypothetical protein
LKVLYTADCEAKDGGMGALTVEGTPIITKPFSPERLVEAVQATLG